jgi:hypothetical protein
MGEMNERLDEISKRGAEEVEEIFSRRAAGIFGVFFKILARNPTEECREVAAALWPQRFQYGFEDRQMGADGALVRLGLAEEYEEKDVRRVRYL